MAFTINTNPSALVALRQLTDTTRGLEETQSRVSTGLKIRTAADDPANFAIAQNLRAQFASFDAVRSSLDRAESTVGIAISAAETIQDLLQEASATALAASDEANGADSRRALSDEYSRLLEQIDSIVSQASFDGTNLLDGSVPVLTALTGTDINVNDADGNGQIDSGEVTIANSISIPGQDLTTAGLGLTQSDFRVIQPPTVVEPTPPAPPADVTIADGADFVSQLADPEAVNSLITEFPALQAALDTTVSPAQFVTGSGTVADGGDGFGNSNETYTISFNGYTLEFTGTFADEAGALAEINAFVDPNDSPTQNVSVAFTAGSIPFDIPPQVDDVRITSLGEIAQRLDDPDFINSLINRTDADGNIIGNIDGIIDTSESPAVFDFTNAVFNQDVNAANEDVLTFNLGGETFKLIGSYASKQAAEDAIDPAATPTAGNPALAQATEPFTIDRTAEPTRIDSLLDIENRLGDQFFVDQLLNQTDDEGNPIGNPDGIIVDDGATPPAYSFDFSNAVFTAGTGGNTDVLSFTVAGQVFEFTATTTDDEAAARAQLDTAATAPNGLAAVVPADGSFVHEPQTVIADPANPFDFNDTAEIAIAQVDAALARISAVLAELGAGARQVELSGNFTAALSDQIEIGIGNLVDADLARESAQLQALQVQQQLGLQSLSIANQAPQSVLSLFQ